MRSKARIDRKLDEIDRRLAEWRDKEIANRIRILKITLWASVIVGIISLIYAYVKVYLCAVKEKAPAWKCWGFHKGKFTTSRLLDEEHFAVGRKGPEVVGDDVFQLVGDLAELEHGGNDLLANVLGVGVGVAVAVMAGGLFEAGNGAREVVEKLETMVERNSVPAVLVAPAALAEATASPASF